MITIRLDLPQTTWELLREPQPDVAVLDIFMPQGGGFGETQAIAFDLVRAIQQQQLPMQVVLLIRYLST